MARLQDPSYFSEVQLTLELLDSTLERLSAFAQLPANDAEKDLFAKALRASGQTLQGAHKALALEVERWGL